MGQRVSRNPRRPCPHDDDERQLLLGDIQGSQDVQPFDQVDLKLKGAVLPLQSALVHSLTSPTGVTVEHKDAEVEVKASVPEDPCKSSNQEDEGYGSLERVPGRTTTSILEKDLVSKKSVVRYKSLKETHERVRRKNGYFERIRLRIVFPPP